MIFRCWIFDLPSQAASVV